MRFDNCSTRCERRQKYKFCLLLETWNNFIKNCKKCYVPSFDLTIEKQLFLCKTRCLFIQYIPKRPEKFGIKFGLLLDISSKYLCNGKSYLGKDLTRNGEKNLPTDFCLWLMEQFLKKGYNVTINNYFTNINLANKRKVVKATLLETIKKKRGTKS